MDRANRGHFIRHYLEMVAAMLVGMAVLGAVGMALSAATGVDFSLMTVDPVLGALKMGLDMSIAMVVWMRYRRHSWAETLEMAAVMFVPTLVLAPFTWSGVMSGDVLMIATHLAMLPLMWLVMLRHRSGYAH